MTKKITSLLLPVAIVLLSAFCTNNKQLPIKVDAAKQPGFAVVELFTSEGCSSCPAADKAVEELAKQYPDDVYVLTFHVDYWDRLGWKDNFSKPEYTQRQNEYAAQFNLSSIYTPQVVINGQREFVGSDKAQLQAATTTELKKGNATGIELAIEAKESNRITVQYKTKMGAGEKLHIALLQTEALTDVKRGENEGRKLHHINIVRDFTTLTSPEGKAQLKLPAGLSLNNTKIIAYVQGKNGIITAVQNVAVTGV